MAAAAGSTNDVHPARWWIPWLLMLPGFAWLLMFFAIPMVSMGRLSLKAGGFSNYSHAFSDRLTATAMAYRNSAAGAYDVSFGMAPGGGGLSIANYGLAHVWYGSTAALTWSARELSLAAGVIKRGSLAHRAFDWLDRFCLRRADAVVVLGRCMQIGRASCRERV